MRLTVFLFFIFLSTLAISQSQMRKYAIMPNDKDTLGYVIVEKVIQNGEIKYKYTNEISVWFIKRFNISSKMFTEFEDGMLKSSDVAHYVNGDTYKSAKHTWTNDHYEIINEDEEYVTRKEPISYSAIQLFFDEPAQKKLVYSETNCIYQPIKEVKQNVYQMVKDNGKLNTYYYRKGILYRMDVDNRLKDFQLRLVDFT